MGGDPVHGIGFIGSLERFEADEETDLVVMIGEIGGDDEERAAAFIAEMVTKPVVSYIAGFTAPAGKRMGMIAISGNDVVVVAYSRDGTCHDGFLANVKMTKAANFLRLILLTGAFFETPDQ